MSHVVLVGDSIFDNAAYTDGGPDVVSQVRGLLPPGWDATLLAVDGAIADDVPRQIGNRWLIEKRAQRNGGLEVFVHTRDQLRRQQRIAAGFEEVVEHADARDAEQFAPDFGELFFHFITWFGE